MQVTTSCLLLAGIGQALLFAENTVNCEELFNRLLISLCSVLLARSSPKTVLRFAEMAIALTLQGNVNGTVGVGDDFQTA